VGDEAVLSGIVHDGFVDGRAIIVFVAAVKVIDFGSVIDVIFYAIHRPNLVRAAHLNLDVLHEEDGFARRVVHMTLDKCGGLFGVGWTGDIRAYARHASSPKRAEDGRTGEIGCAATASRPGDFAFAAEGKEDCEHDKA